MRKSKSARLELCVHDKLKSNLYFNLLLLIVITITLNYYYIKWNLKLIIMVRLIRARFKERWRYSEKFDFNLSCTHNSRRALLDLCVFIRHCVEISCAVSTQPVRTILSLMMARV